LFSYLRTTLCEKNLSALASIWTIISFRAERGSLKVIVSPATLLRVNLLPLGVKIVIRILSASGSVINISRSFTEIIGAGPRLNAPRGGLGIAVAGAGKFSLAKTICAKNKI